ncbi:SH3 domain-containing protein [Rhodanobacter glycinis]|uniref:Cell wall-associated hydrolase, NlpC family n=1 Tax=Rhodanobacter glycinis TaxID=582702 RepID=A0A1I3ZSV1_9GAMM|nr:SH3 domain-containing protein [Rhodanobacter glycinis]SFK47192.1 Cell wall-associated hydrolase, NlpC family [Rhodanobacter glycinis]
MKRSMFAALALAFVFAHAPLQARDAAGTLPIPPSGVLGVGEAQLTPTFWIGLQATPDQPILTRAQIDAQNAKLLKLDPSMHDLAALPASVSRAQVTGWIEHRSKRPTHTLFDVHGQPVPKATLDSLMSELALGAIPAQQPVRYGLVVHRAALRSFPTMLRVFSRQGDTDIDRFQESAEFPGTPVAIVHTSGDGRWLFVISPRYAAWMEKKYVAEAPKNVVLGYAAKTPYRVVTGASVRTVFTPEQPAVSQLQLDMATRVPLLTTLPPDQPVNGQTPYTSYTLQLPMRKDDGSLALVPALLQKNTDTAGDYLPLTPRNLITQAFKFLGERYGWGHAYDGRDCSGFVSDVYRSMGVQMPRNTSDQGVSPALAHRLFTAADSHEVRLKAAMQLRLGDLVYIPGHVMMVLGQWQGQPWVIHDVLGMSYLKPDGSTAHVKLNAVSVTPLLPMLYGKDGTTFIDHMTSIVRMRR